MSKRTPVQWVKDWWEAFLVGLGTIPGLIVVLFVAFVVVLLLFNR